MINGAHAIVYSTDADADRDFLRNVIGLPHVDVGHGWLIFGLPPSEIAVHPSEGGGRHELYFLCDSVEAFVASMKSRGVACSPVKDQGWGLLTELTLPGGGKLGVYQPRHARPPVASAGAARKTMAKPAPKAKAPKVKPAPEKSVARKPVAKKPGAKKPGAKKPVPKKRASRR